jgi:hypothetical protein
MRDTPVRDDGLQISEHPVFQSRFWRAERIAWLIFCTIILLAALGATGDGGPLATRTVASGDLSVEAPAISRWKAEDGIVLRLSGNDGFRSMEVDDAFSEAFEISSISPRPSSSIAMPDGSRWEFRAAPGVDAEIRLVVIARHPGLARYRIRSGTGTALSLTTLILP